MSVFDDDQPEMTAAQIVEDYGVKIDGRPWIVMIELAEPLQETVFAAAVDRHVVSGSSGKPTGISAVFMRHPEHGVVVVFHVQLFDLPTNPLKLSLPVNPVADAGGPMLARLATQTTTQILFFDPTTGEGIGRRVLPVDQEFRDTLNEVCRQSATEWSDPQRWQQLVAAIAHHL